jgi:PBP1b-binding outer membrane lipoprotein LpoB
MKVSIRVMAVALGISFIAGCAVTVPREMKLADPSNRKTVDHPGTNLDSIRLACAETMLNASPASEATDIDVRVLSQGEIVVTEVDAVLKNVGMLNTSLPVTYRCEYRNGELASGTWTRGLK